MKYRIGMDGGGTRTRMVVIIGEKEYFRCETGGINYNSFSKEEIQKYMSDGLSKIAEQGYLPDDCIGIGIGAAGISHPYASQFLKECVKKSGFFCPTVVAGDQDAALLGGIGQAPGILLIAGTGSICISQDGQGHHYRAGGFGHIIDDAGSAYAVGRDILSAIVRAQDGRSQKTTLKEVVFKKLGVTDIGGLIAWIYDKNRTKREIAALAESLTPERIATDAAAAEIADRAAAELVLLIKAVLRPISAGKESLPLLLEGGLILHNERIRESFFSLLLAEEIPVYLEEKKNDAAFGAAFLK